MSREEEPPLAISAAELESRLRPGGASQLGFLGPDESLAQVRDADAETLSRLGFGYDQLADTLGSVLAQALEIYYRPVPAEKIDEFLTLQTDFPNLYAPETIPRFDLEHLPDPRKGALLGHLQVFTVAYKGWQECPWGCDAQGRHDFLILNREIGESVTAPELMPHLIRTHHFFEGRGTPFRTDPEQLARVLGPLLSQY